MSIFSRKKTVEEDDEVAPLKNNSDDYLLALDIGTEYVKALIAKKSKGDVHIVGVGKAHEAPTNMYSGAIADIQGVPTELVRQWISEAETEQSTGNSFA